MCKVRVGFKVFLDHKVQPVLQALRALQVQQALREQQVLALQVLQAQPVQPDLRDLLVQPDLLD